ncbi:UPF0764 protein C16orf89 homolog [Xenia sp. Carnegie-2017]|uniref:UPF0764 protein C16orf89 homolog n=1 Tax=Xenia sp. Carnegie-2017 TaxID=2897299 RepID=UPI001F04C56C|nr:UPF0764 protein C16orf89 homolog [Xenia sp. Carnegie-2017]
MFYFIRVLYLTFMLTFHHQRCISERVDMNFMKALERTLEASERLVSFFEEDVDKVNLDAILGLRIAEGAWSLCLNKYLNSTMADGKKSRIAKIIGKIHRKASSINNLAQVFIKHQSPDYYAMFKPMVDKPWKFYRAFQFNKLPAWNVVNVSTFIHEDDDWSKTLSNRCITEVMGTNINRTKCKASADCFKAITNQNSFGYGTTHQVLFLSLAIMFGCETKYSPILKQHYGYDVKGLVQNRCAGVMREMMLLEKFGFPLNTRDLYIEQGALCGMHGFAEFMTFKRLYNVLSWQRKFGCFGKSNNDDDHGRETDTDLNHDRDSGQGNNLDYLKLMDSPDDRYNQDGTPSNDEHSDTLKERDGSRDTSDYKDESNTVSGNKNYIGSFVIRHDISMNRRESRSFRSMRKLLSDVIVDHGCSSHESGVAAGLLGLYTKWLVEKM